MSLSAAAARARLLRRRRPSAAEFTGCRRTFCVVLPRRSFDQICTEDHSIRSASSFLANLLLRYGFPSSILPQLQKNRFLLDSDPREVQRSLKVLLSFGLSQESLVSIVCSSPRLLDSGFVKRWEIAFSQLGFSPVPLSTVQRILEQSWRSGSDPDDFQRSCNALLEAGFRKKTVAKVLDDQFPSILINSPEIRLRINLLQEIGLSKEEINRIVFSFPGFLTLNLHRRLQPLLDEFAELNLSKSEIRRNFIRNPKVLLSMDPGELHRYIDLLMNLNCRHPIKNKILSDGAIQAGIRVKILVDFLFRHGLIKIKALRVLWKEPRAILYDLDDIKKKIDFLINTMNLSIDWLVEVPEFLGVNLEKQVVPRYNVVEHLRSREALAFQIDLSVLIKLSKMKFYNMFVKPYPECEEIFKPRREGCRIKPRHPKGLWVLFKPATYPQTKEDVCNMKDFMDSMVGTQ